MEGGIMKKLKERTWRKWQQGSGFTYCHSSDGLLAEYQKESGGMGSCIISMKGAKGVWTYGRGRTLTFCACLAALRVLEGR